MELTWEIESLAWPEDVAAAVRMFAGDRELAWLDSPPTSELDTVPSRWSLVAAQPLAVLEQHERRAAVLHAAGRSIDHDLNAWRLWRAWLRRAPQIAPAPLPLAPGWIGYVGFEAARQLERLPGTRRETLGLPLIRMALYDRAIILDHATETAQLIWAPRLAEALGLGGMLGERDLATTRDLWRAAAGSHARLAPPFPARLTFDTSRGEHEAAVAKAIAYIAAGDVYQVNLAQRLRLHGLSDAFSAYAALRRANPAPYGALLRWEGGAIASVSPELFLQLEDRHVLTRPIKGTRRRTGDEERDIASRRDLLESAKDAAELAMIIDLHRNDLGRVCEFGSVRVVTPRRLETHPAVYHTVGEVEGRLAAGRGPLDLLTACFPAGSISGVPKIRALEIIDELEPVARGAYTGAIGLLGLDERMTMNVAIRTLQLHHGIATLYVGGGIVADSEPAREYDETLDKARGILAALGVRLPGPDAATDEAVIAPPRW